MRNEEGDTCYLSRLELIQKLSDREEELDKLRNENRLLKKLVTNLDNEAKRLRAEPFLEESFRRVRRYNRELRTLLKEGSSYSAEEILDRLSIQPSDTHLIKAVNKQLELLESYGLVEYMGRGWKWKP